MTKILELTEQQRGILAPYLREIQQGEVMKQRAQQVVSGFLQILAPDCDPGRIRLDVDSMTLYYTPEAADGNE